MRFSATTLLALPLFAASAHAQLEEYQAQFNNYLDKFMTYIPNPNRADEAAIHEAKTGEKKMSVLTLDNWQETLYSSVQPGATVPEEWWLLVSGRNKTCWGRCGKVEEAFNETAINFANLPDAKTPHMAYINCDDQPILCNMFSAGVPSVWAVDLLPPGNEINIWGKRMNTTTTTAQDFLDLHAANSREDWNLIINVFHPFNSWIAKNGLSVPVAYILWGFTVIPNWAFMLFVSFASRRMMSRRMAQP